MKPVLDHIGIAVRSIEAAKIYEAMGLTIDHMETVQTQGVKTAFLPAGDANLELLEPAGPESAVAKFIDRRGEGIHHICFRVDDIVSHLERLKAQGFRLVNEAPVPGAGGCRVAFLHPAAGNGVLIELSEKDTLTDERSLFRHVMIEGFEPNALVIANLVNPREKFFGVLRALSPAGVTMHAINLDSFDDWIRQIAHGDESEIEMITMFVPLFRIERIFLDEPAGAAKSFSQRFEDVIGRPIGEHLGI